jgi:hypothetical protein
MATGRRIERDAPLACVLLHGRGGQAERLTDLARGLIASHQSAPSCRDGPAVTGLP